LCFGVSGIIAIWEVEFWRDEETREGVGEGKEGVGFEYEYKYIQES
jgi:hypothetical protein